MNIAFQQNDAVNDINAERRARFAELARKFANTVVKSCLDTWQPISVSLVPQTSSPAPAWSTPTNIWFDESAIRFDSLTDIASNKGLTVHEMLHIIYTPRQGAGVTKFAIENGYTRELNILEDQRIETLATGRWGRSARLWLTPTILTHILDKPSAMPTAFILTYGRKYLPVDVRQAVANAFVKPELMPDLARIIDEYITLVFPRDNARGEVLLAEFYALLNQLPKVENGCEGGSTQESSGVRPLPQSQQDKDAQRVPSNPSEPTFPAPKSDDSEDTDDGESSVPENDGQPTDESSDSTPQSSNEPSAPSNTNTDNNSAGNTNAPSDSGESASGKGQSDSGESIVDVLRDALNKSVAEQRDDIINDANAINGMETPIFGNDQNIRTSQYEMESVSPESAQASNAFGRILEELFSKHESGWNRQVSSGKVNIGRWVGGCDFDEAFDRFEAGREDAVDIEAVVLLDVSGSMDDVRREAFESMWAIKRALDTVNASTTVITFSGHSEILYTANDSSTSQMRYSQHSGSTDPIGGLRKAQGIFAESARAVKVLLTITDGSWGDAVEHDKVVNDLRLGGVVTGLVNLATGWRVEDDHNFELVANINNVRGIISLGRELVATATSRNLGY